QLWSTSGQVSLTLDGNLENPVVRFPDGTTDRFAPMPGLYPRVPIQPSGFDFGEFHSNALIPYQGTHGSGTSRSIMAGYGGNPNVEGSPPASAACRVTAEIDRNGNTSIYDYDANGWLHKITSPIGVVTQFVRQPLSPLCSPITPQDCYHPDCSDY